MEKLKLNALKFGVNESLTRKQMKNVLGGSTAPGCQLYGQSCNSGTALNCCSGLVCADHICLHKTR